MKVSFCSSSLCWGTQSIIFSPAVTSNCHKNMRQFFSVLSKMLKAACPDWGKFTPSHRRLLPQPVEIAAAPLTSIELYWLIPAKDISAQWKPSVRLCVPQIIVLILITMFIVKADSGTWMWEEITEIQFYASEKTFVRILWVLRFYIAP